MINKIKFLMWLLSKIIQLLSRSLDKMFEDAELSGVLLLAGRKLKEFPAQLAVKYEISDIISAGKFGGFPSSEISLPLFLLEYFCHIILILSFHVFLKFLNYHRSGPYQYSYKGSSAIPSHPILGHLCLFTSHLSATYARQDLVICFLLSIRNIHQLLTRRVICPTQSFY